MSNPPVISLPNSPGWSRWIERLREATSGRFTIIRELGRGGFAAVFLAHQQQPNRRVAIKLLLPAHLNSVWALDHFRGESQKIAEWRHQSVVTIYEVHEVDDLFFFVMSYVEGGSLNELFAEVGPLSVPIARSVLSQVGSALQYAHRQGVTHRDIKPQNVLIDIDGGAVVTDFGIAKQSGGTSHTVTGMIFGTAPYMAPEQCETGATSIKSDQYSLGILTYEMMTGQPPFTGPATAVLMAHLQKTVPLLRTVRPDCPPELEAAVARMLARNPDDRFPSIADAMQAAGAVELPEYSPERRQFAQAARLIAERAKANILEIVSIPPAIEVGDRIVLRASATTKAGLPVSQSEIEWSSDNDAVARLDTDKCELTALTPGFTTLFIRSGGAEQQVRVDVRPAMAATIQVSGPKSPLRVGDRAKLAALASSKNGVPIIRTTTWESEDPSVAVITPDGVVLALGSGRVRIRASVDQVSAEMWLDVAAPAVEEIRILGAPKQMTVGDRRQLSAQVLDELDRQLTDRTVKWSSSNRQIATVSPSGLVSASDAGEVTITAACEECSLTVSFLVEPSRAVIVEMLNPPTMLHTGDSVRLRAAARDAQGHAIERAIAWSIDDPLVARVSSDGTLTAGAVGRATVTASIDGVATVLSIDVSPRRGAAAPAEREPPMPTDSLAATELFGRRATKNPAPVASGPPSPAASTPNTPPMATPPVLPWSAARDETTVQEAPPGEPTASVAVAASATAAVASGLPMRWIGGGALAVLGIVAVFTLRSGRSPAARGETADGGAPTVASSPATPTSGTVATQTSPASAALSAAPPAAPPAAVTPAPPPKVQSTVSAEKRVFNVTAAPSMIGVGDTSLVVVAGDASTLRALKWSSNNTKLATVSSRGVVLARSAGRVSISASRPSRSTCQKVQPLHDGAP